MNPPVQEKNKALVLEAFDTLFNKRDYAAARRFWSPNYIQHSAHIGPGRESAFANPIVVAVHKRVEHLQTMMAHADGRCRRHITMTLHSGVAMRHCGSCNRNNSKAQHGEHAQETSEGGQDHDGGR